MHPQVFPVLNKRPSERPPGLLERLEITNTQNHEGATAEETPVYRVLRPPIGASTCLGSS